MPANRTTKSTRAPQDVPPRPAGANVVPQSEIEAIFGPPPLLPGEDREVYDEL